MSPARRETLWLRVGVAFVWIATGVLVLHPLYRAIGAHYLGRLGLPTWLMFATCAAEVGLGLVVLAAPASTALTALQAAMIVAFTAILAVAEPRLLVSPFGMLTKNLPILAALGTAWLVEREGWSARARWLLRIGVALIWITEGLFPKILFQQAEELLIAERSGVAFGHPSALLTVIGAAQVASGAAALMLRGRWLVWLLGAQAMALVALVALVSWQVPWLWVHPFGPYTKNVPLVIGTVVVMRRCSTPS